MAVPKKSHEQVGTEFPHSEDAVRGGRAYRITAIGVGKGSSAGATGPACPSRASGSPRRAGRARTRRVLPRGATVRGAPRLPTGRGFDARIGTAG